jgi:hypothetical protein
VTFIFELVCSLICFTTAAYVLHDAFVGVGSRYDMQMPGAIVGAFAILVGLTIISGALRP